MHSSAGGGTAGAGAGAGEGLGGGLAGTSSLTAPSVSAEGAAGAGPGGVAGTALVFELVAALVLPGGPGTAGAGTPAEEGTAGTCVELDVAVTADSELVPKAPSWPSWLEQANPVRLTTETKENICRMRPGGLYPHLDPVVVQPLRPSTSREFSGNLCRR